MKHSLLLLLFCLALCLTSVGCRSSRDRRSLEEFAARWRVLFNAHDIAGLSQLYAPHGAFTLPGMVYPVRSPSEMQSVLDTLWGSAPDMRITAVHQLLAVDNRIAFVWELTRTPLMASAPSKVFGATFITLQEGVIREQLTVTSR